MNGRALSSTILLVALLTASALQPAAEASDRRPVLITVDDLPLSRLHPDVAERRRITEKLLAVLARHQIRAVGLVTWSNVGDGDRALLDRWLEAGHELGNHSHDHRSFTRTEIDDYVADVESARREIAAFLAERGRSGPRFFRFPLLHEGDTPDKLRAMRNYLRASGQRNLPVTLDNADWTFERPWAEAERAGDAAAMARIAEEFHDSLRLSIRHHERTGDRFLGRPAPQILLLHATAVGAAQWDRLFTWLEDRGYRFANADEVLADPVFSEPHEYVGARGPSLWDRLAVTREKRAVREEIEALIQAQAEDWSRGDIEAFTSIYSEDCLFLSPSGLTRGQQEVLDRYRQRYPGKQAMGRLTLEIVELDPISGIETSMVGGACPGRVHGVSVVGRWKLSYPDDAEREDAEGLTLLVFRRVGGEWKIVRDASM